MKRGHTAVDVLDLALGFTFVFDTNGAASAGRVGGHYGGLLWDGIGGWRVEGGESGIPWYGWMFENRSNGFFYGTTV